MKRVIIVGEPGDWNFGSSVSRAFRDVGWDSIRVDWGPWRPEWLARAAHRLDALGAPWRRSLLSRLDHATGAGASLVLVIKGQHLDAATIERLRRRTGAPVVCWNPDSPFDMAISNRGAGLRRAVSAYDAYVTWSERVAQQLSECRRLVVVIAFGVDPHVHYPEPGTGAYRDRVIFVGTYTPQRAALLQRLRTWEPVVFGNGWPTSRGLELRPAVAGAAFRRVVGEARWNLNFLRPQNHDSHNMRSFEIPGCGGRQLAPRTGDHEHFLTGSSSHLFGTEEELLALLDSDLSEALTTDSWRSDNAYTSRIEQLIAFLRF